MTQLKLLLVDDAATRALGGALAPSVRPGMVITLQGDLGAGKTTLVRGLLRGLGHAGRVKSPTFSLLEPYEFSRLDCYHFDLYRLDHPDQWQDSGFRDLVSERALCLIEWPERAQGALPPVDLMVALRVVDDSRELTLTASTSRGERCIQEIEHNLPPGAERRG